MNCETCKYRIREFSDIRENKDAYYCCNVVSPFKNEYIEKGDSCPNYSPAFNSLRENLRVFNLKFDRLDRDFYGKIKVPA